MSDAGGGCRVLVRGMNPAGREGGNAPRWGAGRASVSHVLTSAPNPPAFSLLIWYKVQFSPDCFPVWINLKSE